MNLFFPLLMTFLTGIFMIIGFLIIIFTKNNNRIVNISISIAFFVMLMLILVELIPESVELISKTINFPINILVLVLFIIIGFITLKVLDHFIPDHEIEEENQREVEENLRHIGIVSSIALILHNIIEGMAIYSTTKTSIDMGILVMIGVGLHNIPMGMVVSSTVYKSNHSIKKTGIFTSVIALSTLIGGIIMAFLNFVITDFLLAILLSITVGMLIYIIIFELLGEMLHNRNKKHIFIGMIFGILIFIVSNFLE